MRRVLAGAVAVGVVVWVVSGCGSDPDPVASSAAVSAAPSVKASPSPSETVLTPEQEAAALKKENIQAAKDRLVEYYATTSEVAAAGYQDWQARLSPFFGSAEVYQFISDSVAAEMSLGLTFSGASKVSSMTVTEYTEDPSGAGNERVAMDACIDFSGISATNPDGTPATPPETYMPRAIVQVVMYHGGVGQPWTIGEFQGTDLPC